MKIIYPQYNGEIAITYELEGWSMDDLAKLTTPFDTPYLIVEDIELPEDWSTSSAWEADFSNPDGIGMGPQRWFIAQAESKISAISALPEPEQPESVSDEDHASVVARFNEAREGMKAQQQAIIDQMKAEVLQIEGVQL